MSRRRCLLWIIQRELTTWAWNLHYYRNLKTRGEWYDGEFIAGKKHGYGIEYYASKKKKYEGTLVNGVADGKGVY